MAKKQRTPGYCIHTGKDGTKRGYTRLDGKFIYHPGEAHSQASLRDHDKVVGEWLMRGRTLQRTGDGTDITIGELMASYWSFTCDKKGTDSQGVRRHPVTGHRLGNPELTRLKAIFRVARPLYADTPVAEFRIISMESLLAAMGKATVQSKGRGHLTLSGPFINGCLSSWQAMARWAVQRELAPAEFQVRMDAVDPIPDGAPGFRGTEPVGAVEDKYVDMVLGVCPPTIADMIRVQRSAGMRADEVCQMRPVDIDTHGTVWWYRPPEHKNKWRKQERVVPIFPDAQAVLKARMPTKVDDYFFKPEQAYREGLNMKPLDPNAKEKSKKSRGSMSRRNILRRERRLREGLKPIRFAPRFRGAVYANAIQRACKRAAKLAAATGRDFKAWHSHQLRHAFITEVDIQQNIEAASALAGNSITTAKRYAHGAQVKREAFAMMKLA